MPKRKNVVQPVSVLKEGQEGQILLIVSQWNEGTLILRSGDESISLGRYQQDVVPAEWATKSRDLKSALDKQWISVSWVDENYSPRHLPTPDDAPDEIKGSLNRLELLFAQDSIALQKDEKLAIQAAQTLVKQPEPRDRITDTRYMTETFRNVLQLADWLEERIWNRPKVRSAVREAIKAIGNM